MRAIVFGRWCAFDAGRCAPPRYSIVLFAVAGLLLTAGAASAQTPSQIDLARARGLASLIASQGGDGSWKSKSGGEVASTALALEALRIARIGQNSYAYNAGISWLANATPASVDSLARSTIALTNGGSTVSVTRAVSQLGAWGNDLGGWGAYEKYETSYPDTPLAMEAIRASGGVVVEVTQKWRTYCLLAGAQQAGGGWSYASNSFTSGGANAPALNGVALIPTAYAVLELHRIKTLTGWDTDTCTGNSQQYSLSTALANARTFISGKKKSDGGYGDGATSSVMETASVYRALKEMDSSGADTALALQYLVANQDNPAATGPAGWGGGDVFLTAFVLGQFPAPASTLADTDSDGIPDAVEIALGTNPNAPDGRIYATGGGNTSQGLTFTGASSIKVYGKTAYTQQLLNQGGRAPYTWRVSAGTLPPGLALSPSGVISGVATQSGSFTFSITVTDSLGVSVTNQISMTVGAALHDFDGDGKSDIFWRNTVNGLDYIYLLDGLTLKAPSGYTTTVPLEWQIAGIGDFDGDGKSDVLWRHTTNGNDWIYFMDGVTPKGSSGYITTVPLEWQIAGIGDFDGDGKSDVLWRHTTNGNNWIYFLDGVAIKASSGYLPTVPLEWSPIP